MSEILDKIKDAEQQFYDLKADFEKKRSYANLEYQFKLPRGVYPRRWIGPAIKVHRAAAQLVTDMPKIDITLPHNYKAADEDRRDRQRYFLDLLLQESEKQNTIPPLRDCSISVPKYGAFCLSLWWEQELYERKEWPFRVESHCVENCYPLSNTEFIEIVDMLPHHVKTFIDNLNEGLDDPIASWQGSYTSQTPVKVKKYWSDKKRAFYIEDEPLLVEDARENVMGILPQIWGVSGWGSQSPTGDLRDECVGVNDMLWDIYDFLSYMQSMFGTKVAKDILAPKIIDSTAEIKRGKNAWDDILTDNMDAIKNQDPTKIDPAAYEFMSILTAQVDDMTFGKGLQGQRQGVSGSQDALLTGLDAKTFRAPRVQLENALEELAYRAFCVIEKLADDGVYHRGKLVIRPSHIVHPIRAKFSLEPIDRVKQQAEMLTLKELWIAGAISWENFAMRSGIIDDISQEKRLILVNEIMRDPSMKQLMAPLVMQEFGIREKTEAMNQMRQQKGLPESMGIYGEAANQGQMMGQFGAIGAETPMMPQRANSVPAEEMNVG